MQEDVLGYHPLLVHIPIVLFTLVLVFDLVYYFRKPSGLRVANWMLWLGTVFCVPAMVTGWFAFHHFSVGVPMLYQHLIWSIVLFVYSFFHSVFRGIVAYKKWVLTPVVFIALSVTNLILTSMASESGRLLIYKAASAKKAPSE